MDQEEGPASLSKKSIERFIMTDNINNDRQCWILLVSVPVFSYHACLYHACFKSVVVSVSKHEVSRGVEESRVPKCRRNTSNFVHCFCLISKIFLARRFLSLVLKNDHTFAKQKFKSSLRTMQHFEASWCWPWCCISIKRSIISW